MAIEARRGCGYRKVGGLYLVAERAFVECDRLPLPLGTCPCCGEWIKQARGWTWINPSALFGGPHGDHCRCWWDCPACKPPGSAGLLWIGAQYYRRPEHFIAEAVELGISRRISAIPRGFKAGETWTFLAHPSVYEKEHQGHEERLGTAGVFATFRPKRIERIVLRSEYERYLNLLQHGTEEQQAGDPVFARLNADVRRGITIVPVPDDDEDHNPRREQ